MRGPPTGPVVDTLGRCTCFSSAGERRARPAAVLGAPLAGVVMRYGRLYGPGTYDERPPAPPPHIHVDAARICRSRTPSVTYATMGRPNLTPPASRT
jgi:hypothetical protein